LGIAEALSNKGWGFPLLHDITDSLRIGDVTFVRPGKPTQTVEIKTQLVGERPAAAGKKVNEYRVTVIAPGEASLEIGRLGEFLPPPVDERRALRHTPRLRRQLVRLRLAKAYQDAPLDSLIELDAQNFMSTAISPTNPGYWENLRRIVRIARRTGYAAECIDGAFLYLALYSSEGIDAESVRSCPMIQDLMDSNVLFKHGEGPNSLNIFTIPTTQNAPQLFMPYFLYSLPRTAIADLLHGRMMIFCLVNPGRIIVALEEAGFRVARPLRGNYLMDGSLTIHADFKVDGTQCVAEFQNLNYHVPETIYEFRGLQYLVDIASAMRETAKAAYRSHRERERDQAKAPAS